MPGAAPTRRAIEAVWRIEAARLIGGLVRRTGDLDLAEDLAQEALLRALERWPETGIPANPGAWLMTAARNRGIDEARRRAMADVVPAVRGDLPARLGRTAEARDELLRAAEGTGNLRERELLRSRARAPAGDDRDPPDRRRS